MNVFVIGLLLAVCTVVIAVTVVGVASEVLSW